MLNSIRQGSVTVCEGAQTFHFGDASAELRADLHILSPGRYRDLNEDQAHQNDRAEVDTQRPAGLSVITAGYWIDEWPGRLNTLALLDLQTAL